MPYSDKYWSYSHRELLYAGREGDGWDDGWPHERDSDGWCTNCGVPPGVRHARLIDKGWVADDAVADDAKDAT